MQGDRAATLNSMSGPMVAMMHQMGGKEQDRAQVLVQTVIMPILTVRYDGLLDIQPGPPRKSVRLCTKKLPRDGRALRSCNIKRPRTRRDIPQPSCI